MPSKENSHHEVSKRGILVTFILAAVCWCQEVAGQAVLLHLDTATVIANRNREQSQEKTTLKYDKALYAQMLLQPGVVIRQYGPGGAGSVSFGGLPPSQTIALWNGIPINDPALGQTDFTSLSGLNNQSISIDQANNQVLGVQAAGSVRFSSFDFDSASKSINVSLHGGNYGQAGFAGLFKRQMPKFAWGGAVTLNEARNNYWITDRYSINSPSRRQQNGNILQKAGQVFFKREGVVQILFASLFSMSDRQIAPPESRTTSREAIETRNWFNSLQINRKWNQYQGNFTLGYTRQFTHYVLTDGINYADYGFQSAYIKGGLHKELGASKVGLMGEAITNIPDINYTTRHYSVQNVNTVNGEYGIRVRNYQLQTRFGGTLFSGQACSNYSLNASARYNRFNLEVTSRSLFKAPTLNDLYWPNVGNPRLRPERGWMLGAKGQLDIIDGLAFGLESNYLAYANLIRWLPTDNVFTPQEMQNVVSSQSTIKAVLNTHVGRVKIKANASATYTRTGKVYSGQILPDKQLIYAPIYSFRSIVDFDYNRWSLQISIVTLSRSFINETNTSFIPTIFIPSTSVSYHFLTNTVVSGRAFIEFDNLTNQNYYLIQSYPMPPLVVRGGIQIAL